MRRGGRGKETNSQATQKILKTKRKNINILNLCHDAALSSPWKLLPGIQSQENKNVSSWNITLIKNYEGSTNSTLTRTQKIKYRNADVKSNISTTQAYQRKLKR